MAGNLVGLHVENLIVKGFSSDYDSLIHDYYDMMINAVICRSAEGSPSGVTTERKGSGKLLHDSAEYCDRQVKYRSEYSENWDTSAALRHTGDTEYFKCILLLNTFPSIRF